MENRKMIVEDFSVKENYIVVKYSYNPTNCSNKNCHMGYSHPGPCCQNPTCSKRSS